MALKTSWENWIFCTILTKAMKITDFYLMKCTGSLHDGFAFSHEKIKAIFNLENGEPARNFISIEKCITPTISILILIQIDFETSKIQLFS